jgi:hypothetical protein
LENAPHYSELLAATHWFVYIPHVAKIPATKCAYFVFAIYGCGGGGSIEI